MDLKGMMQAGEAPILNDLQIEEEVEDSDSENEEDAENRAPSPVQLKIHGQIINFPGNPNTNHSVILEGCLSRLREGGHVLLECPVDEDRRLATLQSLLAHQQRVMREENERNRMQQVPGNEINDDRIDSSFRIYYGTSSFKEINEVLKYLAKFQNTGYLENIQIAVLGQPSELCSRCDGNNIFLCSLPGLKEDIQKHEFIEADGRVRTLAHFKNKGRAKQFCPYRHTIEVLLPNANLVICHQEFLISPVQRNKLQLSLENSVVIFDDGGNFENACYQEASISIMVPKLSIAEQCFQKLANCLSAVNQQRHATELTDIIDSLTTFSKCLKSVSIAVDVQARGGKVSCEDSNKLLNNLKTSGLAEAPTKKITDTLNSVMSWLGSDDGIVQAVREEGIDTTIIPVIQKMLSSLNYIHKSSHQRNTKDFSLQISTYVPPGAPKANTLQTRFVNLAAILEPIFGQASSVIISSACLPPLRILCQELSPNNMEEVTAGDVRTRCLFAYCKEGPHGVPFQLNQPNQGRVTVDEEAGEAILHVVHRVQGGIVVFFPSIKALQDKVNCWKIGENRNIPIWEEMDGQKHIFCELDFRKVEDAKRQLQKFQDHCKSPQGGRTGAILLALHRERVSEIMDFEPGEVYAVISMGIPYHSVQAFDITTKAKFLESKGNMDGEDWKRRNNLWYNADAFHNQNSKIAHFVRKGQSWFLALIFDERMEKKVDSRETDILLPNWMHQGGSQWKGCYTFQQLAQKLQDFL